MVTEKQSAEIDLNQVLARAETSGRIVKYTYSSTLASEQLSVFFFKNKIDY